MSAIPTSAALSVYGEVPIRVTFSLHISQQCGQLLLSLNLMVPEGSFQVFVSSMKTRHKNNIHSSNIRSGSLHSIDLVLTYIS